VRRWEKLAKVSRGSKPKAPILDSQSLACMCIVMNCHSRQNGRYFVCKNACDSARSSGGGDQRPLMNEKDKYVCDVCKYFFYCIQMS